jgi:bifunctional DNA-binding transcriptional regulator/antitoxin component of YhaV-PrlF toxin-antitoxin module
MTRALESQAVRSSKASDSVRTTVPSVVATILGLEPGDTLIWEIEPGSGRINVARKPDTGERSSARDTSKKRSSRS